MKKLIISNLLFINILIVFTAYNLYADDKTKKSTKDWRFQLSMRSVYDNNILKYSDKYLDLFMNREDEGRFHINRYDDLIMKYSVDVSYNTMIIPKLKSIFSISVDYNRYSFNTIKNWYLYNLTWQQYIAAPTNFTFSYTYIPEFYVRHYRDEDLVNSAGYIPETFKPFSFTKDDFSFWLQHKFFETTRARFYFSYMRYFHNKYFTEFDSDDLLYGIKIFHSLSSNLAVEAGYNYVTSAAKGYDDPSESKDNSDDADATNDEHIYSAGIDLQLPDIFGLPNSIDLGWQYSRNFFRTDQFLELDPTHAGRNDNNHKFDINYNIKLIKNLSLTAFFIWMKRDSKTSAEENQEYLSNEKDYNQNQIGLNFNYQLQY